MSYILDALQRAAAERQRGQVPGLGEPPPNWADAAPAPSSLRARWLPTAALLLAAAALGALAVWALLPGATNKPVSPVGELKSAPESAPVVAPRAAPAPVPVPASAGASAGASGAGTSVAALVPVPALATSTAGFTPTLAQPTLPATTPAPAATPAREALARAKPTAQRATSADTADSAGTAGNTTITSSSGLRLSPSMGSSKAPRPAAEPSALASAAELPAQLRAQVPDMQVSGVSYSESAALRILIINGRVFQEQDNVAPGLVLERIGPKSAVLRIADQRFRLGY